jgi:hypothetical protein
VGEQPNQPYQLSFNPSLKVDFQGSRVTSDGGLLLVRELDERLGVERTHRRTLDRLTREEHAIADGRSVASGCVPPIGWIRRRERCRAAGTSPDLPAHGFGKNLGARSGADLPVAVVRDGAIGPGREPLWLGYDQPGADRQGGKQSIRRSAWCWTWTALRSRCMGSRSRAPTTNTTNRPASTRCCCSTPRATVLRRSCGPGNVHSAEDWAELRCWAGSRCSRYRRDKETGWWLSLHRESALPKGWARRSIAKTERKMGRSWLCRCGWQTSGTAPTEKRFSIVATGRDGCTMVPFSRSKRKFRV